MESFTPEQYDRFEAFRRHALPKQAVRKVRWFLNYRGIVDKLFPLVDPANTRPTGVPARGPNSCRFFKGLRWRDHRER